MELAAELIRTALNYLLMIGVSAGGVFAGIYLRRRRDTKRTSAGPDRQAGGGSGNQAGG